MDLDEGLLVSVIAVLLGLTVLMVLPYLQFILAAVLVAFILYPLQRRLAPRIGGTPAAVLLVLLSIILLLLPFFLVAAVVASDIRAVIGGLEEQSIDFAIIEDPITAYTGLDIDIAESIRSSIADIGAFDGVVSIFGTLTHLFIGTGLLVFLLFFFVRDAPRFVAWIRSRSPMPVAVTDELITRLDSITRAVLAGHVLVAIIQALLAGIGLFVLGIPNAVFWTFIMIILGLIPIIGTFVVWAPASVYLFMIDRPIAALLLFLYGSIVVGVSDDYLRPVIVDRYAHVSPSAIIIGVIGGLSVFGFMGLFIGPILIAALRESIEVYDDHYGYPEQHAPR